MTKKYHPVGKIIHWLTALCVIIAFVLGPEDVDELDNPSLDLGLQTHETLGLAVFSLTIFRIIWTLLSQRPLAIPMPASLRVISKVLQGSLYLLLIAVPLTARHEVGSVLVSVNEGETLMVYVFESVMKHEDTGSVTVTA